MAKLLFENIYYEWKGDDGTIVFTRTQNVVNALLYYRKQCFELIEGCKKRTPRIMVTESFEELMRKIEKTNDMEKKIRKIEDTIIFIDNLLKKMSVSHKKENMPENFNDNNQPKK